MFDLIIEKNNQSDKFLFTVNPTLWNETCKFVYRYRNPQNEIISKEFIAKKEMRDNKYFYVYDFNLERQLFDNKDGVEICVYLIQKEGSGAPILVGNWINKGGKWKCDPNVVPYPSRMIGFSLTNQCNLKCMMCWQKNRQNPVFLPLESIKKVIESVKLFGKPPVYLWGGEPFLHPEIWPIIHFIKESGFFCIANTNGLTLESHAQEIIDSRIDMLVVSLDGEELIHDQIRGRKGTFQKVVHGLEKIMQIRKRRPIMALNCVINELNYQMLDRMVNLKNKIGIDYLEFQFLIFYTPEEVSSFKRHFIQLFGYEPKSADSYVSNYGKIEIDELYKMMERINQLNDPHIRFFPYALNNYNSVSDYFTNAQSLNIKRCESIYKSFWVEPNGDVVTCSIFPGYVAGNINQQDFFSIWNGELFRDFRNAMSKGLFSICYRCCDLYKKDYF
ncbi:MAG: radical SAM protein [Firmicutes bacterium]|nr:radical SAM protein [Bacillota bacterium]